MRKIEVVEIRGPFRVHKVADRIIIDDPRILLRETDALCAHALPSLLRYALALEWGADRVSLGLSKLEDKANACIQCADPGEPCTEGGTAIFRVSKVSGSSKE